MLVAEAHWIRDALEQLSTESISPLLNVGSATSEFREKAQPWIHSEIFAPLSRRGVAVDHADIQEGQGIDLRGDLTDDCFIEDLRSRKYKVLLCCNLLEHITNPASTCRRLEQVVPVGGYLLVTVPNRFPYHPDPIDTMFRPSVEELTKLFPQCEFVNGAILDCGTGWDYVDRNPRVLIRKVMRRLSGAQEHGGMKGSTSFAPWLFRQFRQTCALLRRAEAKE